MTVKEVWKYVGDWFAKLFAVIFILAIIGGAIKACSDGHKKTNTPVEKGRIDSITKENDKLILEVVRVDSIIRENNNTKIIIEHLNNNKNEEVIKVRNLSNDSTLRLFYKLIGK